MQIREKNKIVFTGVQQHGFNQAKSTLTTDLIIQSILLQAIDNDNYVLKASIHFSAAFDLANKKLQIQYLNLLAYQPGLFDGRSCGSAIGLFM